MTRALVLGAGMVGSAMALDLHTRARWHVTVADRDANALQPLAAAGLHTHVADLSVAANIVALARDHDIVLGALASRLGLATLRAVIEAQRDYVDISFMADDALAFDELARAQGVTAIVDCGVAPGMSNMMCGFAAANLSPCTSLRIYVGGLPVERRWPWEYKAGFAPSDVLEEYTRPARLVIGGRTVVREALAEPELLDFPVVGTLEAFLTDGLRSLVDTLQVPDMVEKTMRYPGHIERVRVLRDLGLLDDTPIDVGGQRVVPRDVLAAVLFPKWTFAPGEADITVMRVEADGMHEGAPVRWTWDLVDRYDPVADLRSMSRTTAYPATIMAELLVARRYRAPGVHPPEHPGAVPGLLDEVLAKLGERGVVFGHRREPLPNG